MTRPQFDTIFAALYQGLCRMAEKRVRGMGAEAVNMAYIQIIDNDAFRSRKSRGVSDNRAWIQWRVKSQVGRIKDTERVHGQCERLEEEDEHEAE